MFFYYVKFYELLIYIHKQIIEDKIYNIWLIGGYDKEISLYVFNNKLMNQNIFLLDLKIINNSKSSFYLKFGQHNK